MDLMILSNDDLTNTCKPQGGFDLRLEIRVFVIFAFRYRVHINLTAKCIVLVVIFRVGSLLNESLLTEFEKF